MKQIFFLAGDRNKAVEAIRQAPEGYVMEVKPNKRSEEQSRYMWALLSDIAKQKEWCGLKMEAEDWKNLFTAALKGQRTTNGLTGGVVVLATATSKMSKEEMSELIEYIISWGIENGVQFSDETH
jgi:hypothetical protein